MSVSGGDDDNDDANLRGISRPYTWYHDDLVELYYIVGPTFSFFLRKK